MANEKKTTAVKDSVFGVLSAIDCSEHTEIKKSKWKDKKGVEHEIDLTYLSWAWAWHICKTYYPEAFYTIYETPEGRPYFDDGRTCWVKTGVTIMGQEHIEYLPIMDYRNLSIPVDMVTSMDMNKAIQRSLTKALARHGLGLYIYAGEDLPWTEEEAKAREEAAEKAGYNKPTQKAAPAQAQAAKKPLPQRGSDEWNEWAQAIVSGWKSKQGKSAVQVFQMTYEASEDIMQDALAALEEDAFDLRLSDGKPATQSANV